MCKCPEKYHGDGVSTCSPNNPCDAVPCFLGLECTNANASYTCEKCPPFFDGDGINCVRNKSESEQRLFSFKLLQTEKKAVAFWDFSCLV